MPKFKGIIFDIDGTLTSTNELIFASFNFITNKYLGKNLTPKEIIALFGPTEDVILKDWCGDNYNTAREEYYSFYRDNHHMADLYPGIKEVLESIKQKNIPISIYTGKGRDSAIITLSQLGIINYFNMIVTGDDVAEHKPSPEGINKFVVEYNLNPDDVLMIGDAVSDIKAARAAGVSIASVLWDSYSKSEVIKHKSDYVFHSVDELKEMLEKNI
ncbi:MAG: HAD family hydrolase [Ignavibacteriales bacterium]|nr:MAG: HAD family hydrolase [Ignavibacteriales bacterium]